MLPANTSLGRSAGCAFFNLFFGFHVVDNRRARSILTLCIQGLPNGLLDTPKDRLLHYAVFFHFSILAIVHYKESA